MRAVIALLAIRANLTLMITSSSLREHNCRSFYPIWKAWNHLWLHCKASELRYLIAQYRRQVLVLAQNFHQERDLFRILQPPQDWILPANFLPLFPPLPVLQVMTEPEDSPGPVPVAHQ